MLAQLRGTLEDLHLPLHFAKFKNEKLDCSLQALLQSVSVLDLSAEVKQFLQWVPMILEVQEPGDAVNCGRFKESKELLITISESKTDLSGQGFHIPLLSKSKDAILWMSEKAAFTLSVAVEWNSLHKLLVLTCKILQLW